MLRRGARERRELVYRRALDQKKRETEEKREKEKPKSVAQAKTDRSKPKEPTTLPSDIDNEYRWAGCEDPVVCITTSHNPSAKLKKFAKV